MTNRVERTLDGEQVLSTSSTTRELAGVLRALSRAAREHSTLVRSRNHMARERATALVAARARYGARSRAVAASDDVEPIALTELVDILVEHHGWHRFVAQVMLAIELEIVAVPLGIRELDPDLAMEVFDRVLARGPA